MTICDEPIMTIELSGRSIAYFVVYEGKLTPDEYLIRYWTEYADSVKQSTYSTNEKRDRILSDVVHTTKRRLNQSRLGRVHVS